MAKDTPEGKRVRSLHLGSGGISLATGVPQDIALASFTWTDDVRVIGAQLYCEFLVLDAHVNADGQINYYVELTRQSQRGLGGIVNTILMNCGEKAWSAAIVTGGGDNRKGESVMFPEGYGQDFDEGEVISVLGLLEWLGAGGTLNFYMDVLVYYVER